MKHYNVVAAVIWRDNKILCMQKGETKYSYTSYKYEFPGGKIEEGETPQQALKRELMEEMNYNIEVGEKIISVIHEYPDFCITLTAFSCTAPSSYFKMNEHIAYRWLCKEELKSLDWAAADIDIVNAILE